MTASKIHQEIRKVYPAVWIEKYPQLSKDTYRDPWYVSDEPKGYILGAGRTAKQAWVAAYEKVQEELKQKS